MRSLAGFFEQGLSPSEVAEKIGSGENLSWKESLEKTRKVFDPASEISKTEDLGIKILAFNDPAYPALLKEISDPPLLLYCKGDLLESDQAAVAVVGSRHPSFYGIEQAKRFAKKLSESGLSVVSGFARGIDSASHEAALEVSGGRTIAVLGSGLDVVYPRENRSLYERILERGFLLSEFSLGTPPLAENFPKRNRIIAGLSYGVLVVEAHTRSGSLITAHLAADEGREVFAIPGRIDQLGSGGSHRLIREGALLVENPEEILEVLAPQLWPLVKMPNQPVSSGSEHSGLSEEEKEFLKYFEDGNLTPDEAAQRGNLPIFLVRGLFTRLELKRALRKRPDGRYECCGTPN